jgi:protein SCO1/2
MLFVLIATALGGCAQPYIFRGTEIQPAKAAPDFTLTDQNGQPFTLSEQRGNVVLLFFGFTSCPDICPTTLADIAAAREQLGQSARDVKVALVTIDPERDTPQKLGTYVARYDPSFIGLTGDRATIDPLLKTYGVGAIKREMPESKLGYTYDHAAYIYLIDRSGNWRAILPFGITPEDIASDTAYLIRS